MSEHDSRPADLTPNPLSLAGEGARIWLSSPSPVRERGPGGIGVNSLGVSVCVVCFQTLSDQSHPAWRNRLSIVDAFRHTGGVKALTSESDWKTLLSHLPENFEQLAIEHRLLNPQWP